MYDFINKKSTYTQNWNWKEEKKITLCKMPNSLLTLQYVLTGNNMEYKLKNVLKRNNQFTFWHNFHFSRKKNKTFINTEHWVERECCNALKLENKNKLWIGVNFEGKRHPLEMWTHIIRQGLKTLLRNSNRNRKTCSY